MSLAGKVAIVTGSATGVGAGCALLLARNGVNVVINYTKSLAEAEETEKACAAEGVETLLVQGDISVDADCRRLADAATAKWGRIDILVNNAGTTKFAAHSDLEALDAEDFHKIYAVNVVGTYQMTRAAAPALKASGEGSVIMISSVAGLSGIGSSIAYAASKGALNTMTMSLARSLAPEVRVNAICPSMIETRWLREGYGEERYESLKKRLEDSIPLGRVSKPEDIAQTVLWLVSGANLTTGETIRLDGGAHLGPRVLTKRL
ncbi:SDR family NAD(P)-dependent oxidoreductase [Oceanibacterium hippocampi]|uniref:Glucose 1-dehydrogenase 2 n=1 Tax=Oceanibacterium hippocampi TaxID=745714 RepID=A0A1Y5SLI2_9PROT|nr:glucose 1-dehydrogenase [Oceanibacterium hippocampi]SLN43540.1 Glucose 1-dehydrogenase 2 [Oceanibacterium hippocampi]